MGSSSSNLGKGAISSTPRPALNMPSTKVFLCLIGVIILVTEATGNDEVQCSGSATLLTTSQGLDMVLCKDMTMSTCEKDFETLCPAGWNLCTPGQFNNRNNGWDFNWLEANAKPLGVIYCYTRAYAYDGDVPINYVTEARHYGPLGPSYGRQRSDPELSADIPLQCESASSRPGCTYWANYNHDLRRRPASGGGGLRRRKRLQYGRMHEHMYL